MPEPIVIDPYVERILKARGETAESMAKILAPEPEPEVTEEVPFALVAAGEASPMPKEEKKELTDAEKEAAEKQRLEAEEAEKKKSAEETPEQKAEREAKEAEAAKAAAATTAVATTAAPLRPVVVQKKEEKKVDETAAAKQAREEEEAYINGLTDDQKDEIELAEFAETHGKPGLRQKVLDYYRKLDKFALDNPDADPESAEFIKFKEANEPKLGARERRLLERDMIAERAAAKAAEETRKQFAPVERELNEIKSQPIIKAVTSTVAAALSKAESGTAIDAEVVAKIQTMPTEQALDEFPDEAPIVIGTMNKAREWTRIWNGVVDVDMKNPDHQWLMRFIEAKELEMASRPAADQVRNGKRFVPLGKFIELERTNPAAAAQSWTLDHAEVVKLISENGVKYYQSHLKKMEKAGWQRKAVEKKTGNVESEAGKKQDETTTQSSPKAGAHTMVGAGAEAAKTKNEDVPPHMRGLMAQLG